MDGIKYTHNMANIAEQISKGRKMNEIKTATKSGKRRKYYRTSLSDTYKYTKRFHINFNNGWQTTEHNPIARMHCVNSHIQYATNRTEDFGF